MAHSPDPLDLLNPLERWEPVDPRDPLQLRDDAPLLDAWLRFRDRAPGPDHPSAATVPFTVPGHKQRQDLVGEVVRGDVPLFGGLDDVKASGGLLAEAERRAAQLWGASWCRFSVAGSTHGNLALALAVGSPGRTVIVSRTLHRSLLLGLVLAGLTPIWVRPPVDPATGLPGAVQPADVALALSAHPDACAVMVGDPSYAGILGDTAGLAEIAHQAGVPLIVDAAWSAHLGFHPALTPHALAAGADAMVTSAHKALPAYSQAALVLARTTADGGLLDADRLERAFDATHTTSPAGAILASTDAARALLSRYGHQLSQRLLDLVAMARARLSAVPGLAVLQGPGVDPTKLVVLLAGTGAHGHRVEADLIAGGYPVEMADRDVLIAMVTFADDQAGVSGLIDAVIEAVQRHRGPARPPLSSAAWLAGAAPVAMAPREAFFAAHETVSRAEAVGRVSAELIAPYPPGVPAIAPGELVTSELLDALVAARADGGRIAYAADPTLSTVQVVARPGAAAPPASDPVE